MAEDPVTREVLDVARQLRAQGRHSDAAELLDATLQQTALHFPADLDTSRKTAWLQLERAHLMAEAAQVVPATRLAAQALETFERLGDGPGAATSVQLLGDLSWLQGSGAEAASLWSRARALADQGEAPLLAARALLALALRASRGGDQELVEGLLQAAEARQAGDALDPVLAAQQTATRAGTAVLRAVRAVMAHRYAEAQLLLASAAHAARDLGDLSLYIECLRVDASLARRCGDPHGAVHGLRRAIEAARLAGMTLAAWDLESQLCLALVEDEDWVGAAELLDHPTLEGATALPAVLAGRIEATAALARHRGDLTEAAGLWQEAAELRHGDRALQCRTRSAWGETLLAAGQAGAEDVLELALREAILLGREDLEVGPTIALLQLNLQKGCWDAPAAAAAVLRARNAGSVAQQLAALDVAVEVALQSGEVLNAREVARQQVALAQSQPLVRWQARSLARLATVLARQNLGSEALNVAQQAYTKAKESADPEGEVRALLALGDALGILGRVDEARLVWGRCEEAGAGGAAVSLVLNAKLRVARSLAVSGDFRNALALFDACREEAASANNLDAQVASLRGLAWCARETGLLADAASRLAEAERACPPAAATWLAGIQTEAAQVSLLLGDPNPGLELLNRPALATAPSDLRAEALVVAGHACAMADDWARAEAVLEQAVVLRRDSTDRRALGAALYLAGQVALRQGKGERAGRHLGEALVVATALGLPEQARIRATIERLRADAGD